MATRDSQPSGLVQQQIDKVNQLAYEAQLMAKALQVFIEQDDETGTIYPVSRTMLARIVGLTDAMAWALEPTEWKDGPKDGLQRAGEYLVQGRA